MRGFSILFCMVAAVSICSQGEVQGQQPRTPARSSARKPHKVANPLNDLLDQAQAAMDRKDYRAAVETLNKFVSEQPAVAYAHFQLAYAYTGLDRWRGAQPEYRRPIELDPKLAPA